jgi:hypothetical protein
MIEGVVKYEGPDLGSHLHKSLSQMAADEAARPGHQHSFISEVHLASTGCKGGNSKIVSSSLP